MAHCLYLEVDGIQRFVFASTKLKIIRGGSALLDIFNRVQMQSAARDGGGEVVFAGGGHCLIQGLSQESAESLGNDLRRRLRKDTEGQVNLSFGIAPEGDWKTTRAAYLADMAKRALKRAPEPPPLPPFVALCASCGVSPARSLSDAMQDRERKPLCGACARRVAQVEKRTHAGDETIWQRLRPYLGEHGRSDEDAYRKLLPDRELGKLAEQGSGPKYLAYLYCDGNGLGRRLAAAPSAAAYGALSELVDSALHKAVASAIQKHCPPERSGGSFGAEVLLLGGDDLIVALPADRGATFTQEVLKVFHRETDRAFRLSAGLVLAPHTTPITILQQVATALLRSAKRYAYLDETCARLGRGRLQAPDDDSRPLPPAVGYVDFQELTSGQVDIERAHAITCKPYRLDDFAVLVSRAAAASIVPRGRLHALAEAIRGSEREARTMAQIIVGRARSHPRPERDERGALLALLRPLRDNGTQVRVQPYYTYPEGGDLPFDLYGATDPRAHRWSLIPDALELMDHLDSKGGRV